MNSFWEGPASSQSSVARRQKGLFLRNSLGLWKQGQVPGRVLSKEALRGEADRHIRKGKRGEENSGRRLELQLCHNSAFGADHPQAAVLDSRKSFPEPNNEDDTLEALWL